MNSRIVRNASIAIVLAAISLDSTAQNSRPLTPPPLPQQLPQAWTDAPTLPLWPEGPPGSSAYASQSVPDDWPAVFVRNVIRPQLHVFAPSRPDGRALLVVPGGAYQFVSIFNEGVELAERMLPLGITLFVLTYRLPAEGWADRADVPLQDAQRAIRVIRAQADQYAIDTDRVAVLGFSAGGHLAATLATAFDEHVYDRVDSADSLSARPQVAGLVYPVVTMDERWTHALSRSLLLGATPSAAAVRRRSAELNVDATTPPIFIVHAMDDQAVPVENSIRLMEAMREADRPVEAHLLEEGGHAFGIGYPQSPSAYWVDLFDAWWKRQ
jgi:acetyl esterase/lipase